MKQTPLTQRKKYQVVLTIPQYDCSTLWQSLYEEVYGPVWGTTYRYHNTDMKQNLPNSLKNYSVLLTIPQYDFHSLTKSLWCSLQSNLRYDIQISQYWYETKKT